MLSINKRLFLTVSYHRLFLQSSILTGYSSKLSSSSSHNNNKRHRSSSFPPSHHHPHNAHSHSHRTHSNKNANQVNTLRRLFQPVDVKPVTTNNKLDPKSADDHDSNIGQELTGGKTLDRST